MSGPTTLSRDALYETARALADRGQDYGVSVYYDGSDISPERHSQLVREDPNFASWYEAFQHVLVAYHDATGEDWSY